jgi:hypothetical protein
MPAPVVAAILGQALIQAVTKPWPWLALAGYLAVAKFNWGAAAEEFRRTVWDLWPFVILLIVLWFGLLFYRSYLELSRRKQKR